MRSRPRPVLAALTAVAVTAVLAGCSADITGTGSPDPSSLGWSVRQALSWLPVSALDDADSPTALIVLGDLNAASTAAGLTRPAPDASDDDIADWAIGLSGVRENAPPVTPLLPDAVVPQSLARAGDIRDELGWNITAVGAYAEIQAPPFRFAVLDGTFDTAAISAAQGDPVDRIWRLGPDDDLASDLEDATPARPLGQSMRTALDGNLIAVSPLTPPVSSWLDHPASLDTDSTLGALADALDANDVYTALLLPDASQLTETAPPTETEPDLPDAFNALGIGLALVDDTAVVSMSYAFSDDETAAANVEPIRSRWEDGFSYLTMEPWNERFTVNDVAVAGSVVTVTAEVVHGPPSVVWSIVYNRDALVVHG